ncbi:hypothetical protein KR51_00005550 [Rubidibacter lacunae KORDI 51-2]|uniref:Uncharacterized protein n=1 Tax=Rubidibacter lacunae KORDI 51-2 TaxID=582515 RepID=U5DDX3_9CHRO|nr:hypothetical protein KR51_00005550 [Rubidibacter lacunae KORDI 51-2]
MPDPILDFNTGWEEAIDSFLSNLLAFAFLECDGRLT